MAVTSINSVLILRSPSSSPHSRIFDHLNYCKLNHEYLIRNQIYRMSYKSSSWWIYTALCRSPPTSYSSLLHSTQPPHLIEFIVHAGVMPRGLEYDLGLVGLFLNSNYLVIILKRAEPTFQKLSKVHTLGHFTSGNNLLHYV